MRNAKLFPLLWLMLLLFCPSALAGGDTAEVSAGYLNGLKLAQGKAAPLVLIIPGSGPVDRDGNTAMGKSGIYRQLAEELFDAYGVASVRADKRGMFASSAPGVDPNAVTMKDYADDARLWVGSLKQDSPDGCVWLLGHSEGALVALIAAQEPEGICGLVLAAPPGRKMGEILREQLQNNPANAPIIIQAFEAIGEFEAGRKVDITPLAPPLQQLFYPAVQNFLIDQMSYDPAALIAGISLPVLIVQGEADLQISPERDAEKLHKALPGSKLVLLPGVTHVLKKAASDSPDDNYVTYIEPDAKVHDSVIDAIGSFIIFGGDTP